MRKGLGASGYTFEALLKKEEDNFPTPDYNNIEIKTMNDNTKHNLHLFNLIPDGDYLFPIERILCEIGCPSKENHNLKFLFKGFKGSEYTKLIYGHKAIIKVNYDEKKVELIVINYKNENTNIGISWSFNYLKKRLLLKLGHLCLVRCSSCIICGEGYYYYHDIAFYKLKSFDTFLSLIDNGTIEITFKIGTHKDGKKAGKVYDHGTDFSIKVTDLELLFDKVMV